MKSRPFDFGLVAKGLYVKKLIPIFVLAVMEKHSVFAIADAIRNEIFFQIQISADVKNFLLIDVNTEGIDLSHFEKAAEAIERGYAEADKHRKTLKKLALGNPPLSPFSKGGIRGIF